MSQLPASIQQFIEQQKTLPVDELRKEGRDEYRSAYGSYWYRAVVCMLLAGRIQPKANGDPNRTDTNRLGKEANFNQYLLERIGRLLIKAQAIKVDRRDGYVKGPGLAAWWSHDVAKLQQLTRKAFLDLVQEGTGYQAWRPTTINHSHLIEFLQLFFSCFQDRALPEGTAEQVLEGLSQLPEDDLFKAAKSFRIEVDGPDLASCKYWLDEKGRKALISALSILEWLWYDKQGKATWLLLSPLGAGMLGLKKMPPAPDLYAELKVLPNHSILAGPGRDVDGLVPLFRYCKINRIDQVYEFQLDRKHLAQMPARPSPTQALHKVLEEAGPLPPTVEDVLGTRPKVGGAVRVRWCSALVQPESAEVLEAIRQHPRLKGYLAPGAPPGYLLLGPRSSPENFVLRCQELGFQVSVL